MSPFHTQGWQVFEIEDSVTAWARAALEAAQAALADPDLDHWYQCDRTWFVGLDALPNDGRGAVPGGPALQGAAVEFAARHCGGWPELHRAQISGVFPGYPKPRAGENAAGLRYRQNRDAAHVDGLLGIGTPKRRFVREPHAFILGLPLTQADPQAAPLVVWEGSHLILQQAFRRAFAGCDLAALEDHDVTEIYQAARREVFESCARQIVHAPPGGAILVHRMALHGVAPFVPAAQAAPPGRLIAYFRPPMPGGVRAWLDAA